jgi:hypothetical protein
LISHLLIFNSSLVFIITFVFLNAKTMISYSYLQQDTVSHKSINPVFSGDSLIVKNVQTKDSVKHKSIIHPNLPIIDNSDTSSICSRNSVSDVTFYDRDNFVFEIGKRPYKQFPFIFTEKVREKEALERILLIKHLKNGNDLPPTPLHTDWMIVILLTAAFLFSFVRRTSGNLSSRFTKFFTFRGVSEPVSSDIGGLFYWQSTIMNLVSFLIIGLYCFSAAEYYNLIPTGIKGIIIWLIAFGIISLAVTLRHLACIITGAISEEHEVFREYLLSIYQSYRFGALFLSAIIILITYTRILPVNDLIISGIVILSIMYLIRVIRLLIIFLNRNISIFYLILYLCALEILPVLIIAKYFTGLV